MIGLKKLRVFMMFLFLSALLIPAACAVEYESASNRYAFSDVITAAAPVEGDYIAFGQTVRLDAGVGGDIVAAGRTIQIADSGNVQNLYTAGQIVSVQVNAARNVYAAGYEVNVNAANLAGGAYLAGSNVSFTGAARSVRATGGTVLIDGNISDNLTVYSDNITFSDRTVVGGTIDLYGSQRPALPASIDQSKVTFHLVKTDQTQRTEAKVQVVPKLIFLVAAIVLALFAALLAGRFLGDRASEFKKQVGWMILWGLVSFIVIPIASVLCMCTVIGLPLGLIALMLYGILLYLAPVLTGVILGRLLLPRMHPIVSALIGAAVVKLLTFIPYLGALLYLACAFYVLGCVVVKGIIRRNPSTGTPEPPADSGPPIAM